MTVRLNSSGVTNTIKQGHPSSDLRIITCTDRPTSKFMHHNIMCGVSGATRYLASLVGQLRPRLGGTAVRRTCININKCALRSRLGAVTHAFRRRAHISSTVIADVRRRGTTGRCPKRGVLMVISRRCGVNGGSLGSPMNMGYAHVRNGCLGVLTHASIVSGANGDFRLTGIGVTGSSVTPLITTSILLASGRHHRKYILISFNTSAAAISICGKNCLHFLAIVPVNKRGVAHSLYSLRLSRRRTRHVGHGCNLIFPTSTSRAIRISTDHFVRIHGIRSIVRTHFRRVVLGIYRRVRTSNCRLGGLLTNIIFYNNNVGLGNVRNMLARGFRSAGVHLTRSATIRIS